MYRKVSINIDITSNIIDTYIDEKMFIFSHRHKIRSKEKCEPPKNFGAKIETKSGSVDEIVSKNYVAALSVVSIYYAQIMQHFAGMRLPKSFRLQRQILWFYSRFRGASPPPHQLPTIRRPYLLETDQTSSLKKFSDVKGRHNFWWRAPWYLKIGVRLSTGSFKEHFCQLCFY